MCANPFSPPPPRTRAILRRDSADRLRRDFGFGFGFGFGIISKEGSAADHIVHARRPYGLPQSVKLVNVAWLPYTSQMHNEMTNDR